MVGLEINKRTFWYALQTGEKTEYDNFGNEAGLSPVYGKPVKMRANISPSRGDTANDLFGINAEYTRTINPLPKDCPIDEASVLWVDKPPVMDENGATKTGHDYVVVQIAESLGHKAYAIKKVSVADGVTTYGSDDSEVGEDGEDHTP